MFLISPMVLLLIQRTRFTSNCPISNKLQLCCNFCNQIKNNSAKSSTYPDTCPDVGEICFQKDIFVSGISLNPGIAG